MSASLVGSEMCIRDSTLHHLHPPPPPPPPPAHSAEAPNNAAPAAPPVSYTHLTLPTICSV
eukprot:10980046-Alexandrium_andersonii.AAC.1